MQFTKSYRKRHFYDIATRKNRPHLLVHNSYANPWALEMYFNLWLHLMYGEMLSMAEATIWYCGFFSISYLHIENGFPSMISNALNGQQHIVCMCIWINLRLQIFCEGGWKIRGSPSGIPNEIVVKQWI